jgi:hypothetical protein
MCMLANFIFLIVVFFIGWFVFVAIWTPTAWFLTRGRFRRARATTIVVGPIVYLLIIALYCWNLTRPAWQFKHHIGFAPPADVTALRSEFWQLGDSGHLYLTFNCSPATAARLVKARGMKRVDSITVSAPHYGDWKPPPLGPSSQVYEAAATNRMFANESELFIYDPTNGVAYYCWLGMD